MNKHKNTAMHLNFINKQKAKTRKMNKKKEKDSERIRISRVS